MSYSILLLKKGQNLQVAVLGQLIWLDKLEKLLVTQVLLNIPCPDIRLIFPTSSPGLLKDFNSVTTFFLPVFLNKENV